MKTHNLRFKIIQIVLFTWMLSNSLFGQTSLSINFERTNHLEISEITNNTISILTTGNDPYSFTHPLSAKLPKENSVLSFDYFCPKGLDHLEIYFDVTKPHSKMVHEVGMSEGWVKFSVDLSEDMKNWGNKGDSLRLDFGSQENVNIQLRNIELRPMSEREKEIATNREMRKEQEAILEQKLKDYLSTDYPLKIDNVSVSENEINIRIKRLNEDSIFLCEATPYMDVTETHDFDSSHPILKDQLEIKIDRFNDNGSIIYDRLLSKWVLAKKQNGIFELKSHARYADEIESKNNLPDEKPTSKKGLGGLMYIEDMLKIYMNSI